MSGFQNKVSTEKTSMSMGSAGRKELLAWALYDFANSGYTTVVQTTIFSAYFVGWLLVSDRVYHQVCQHCFGRWLLELPILL